MFRRKKKFFSQPFASFDEKRFSTEKLVIWVVYIELEKKIWSDETADVAKSKKWSAWVRWKFGRISVRKFSVKITILIEAW